MIKVKPRNHVGGASAKHAVFRSRESKEQAAFVIISALYAEEPRHRLWHSKACRLLLPSAVNALTAGTGGGVPSAIHSQGLPLR